MISSYIYYDIEYDIIHQYHMILGILVIHMISYQCYNIIYNIISDIMAMIS
jgi:hypothetical protein